MGNEPAVSYTQEEREKLKKEQQKRAKKYGITPKEGGNLTKPKEYENVPDSKFLDPVNYRYPIDEAHLMPALRYFNHEGQREAGGYSKEEWAKMGRRLAKALSESTDEKYKYDPKTEKVVKEPEQAKAAVGPYVDFKKARTARKVERLVDEELWDIFSALRDVISNILASDAEDKAELLRKAFNDALNEIAKIAELEIPEGDNMNADARVRELEAELEKAKQKIEDLEARLTASDPKDGEPQDNPELEALKVANEKLAQEKQDLEKRLSEIQASLNERIVKETNEAREAKLREAGVEKDEIIAKWKVSVGEDGKIAGRSDEEFEDFVATLKEAMAASGGGAAGGDDDPVKQSKQVGNIPASGAGGDDQDKIQQLFQAARARVIPADKAAK